MKKILFGIVLALIFVGLMGCFVSYKHHKWSNHNKLDYHHSKFSKSHKGLTYHKVVSDDVDVVIWDYAKSGYGHKKSGCSWGR